MKVYFYEHKEGNLVGFATPSGERADADREFIAYMGFTYAEQVSMTDTDFNDASRCFQFTTTVEEPDDE